MSASSVRLQSDDIVLRLALQAYRGHRQRAFHSPEFPQGSTGWAIYEFRQGFQRDCLVASMAGAQKNEMMRPEG